jgi:hypothetical protein
MGRAHQGGPASPALQAGRLDARRDLRIQEVFALYR